MAIYIVFNVVNHDHIDPFIDVKRVKKDEVLAVLPSDNRFTQRELTNPEWRIVYAENLSIEDGANFLMGEIEQNPQDPNPIPMIRGFKLDRNNPSLTQNFLDFLNDDTRAEPVYSTKWPRESLYAVKVQKPTRRGELIL